jgi:glutamate carboxypeptidase
LNPPRKCDIIYIVMEKRSAPVAVHKSEISRIAADIYEEMLSFLIKIAEINSGSNNAEGIHRVIEHCEPLLLESGFDVHRDERNHLLAKRKGARKPAILIVGHLDTVFSESHPFRHVSRRDETLNGPGVGDMKGGIALALYGMLCLGRIDLLDDRMITVLFNSDEETGSKTSRALIEAEARMHDLVLVFEGGKRVGDLTTFVIERQGVGMAQFVITGMSSHAGMDHEHAVNVIEEMSYKIIELQKLTDYERGTTVSPVGEIEVSDSRRNVIPEWVKFKVDFRFRNFEERDRLFEGFRRIAETAYMVNSRTGKRARCTLDISLWRPPMIPTEKCLEYAAEIEKIGHEIGHSIVPRTRPGGSDGCYTAALGVTTLDGLGPVGSGWHTDEEYLELPSLKKRMELFLRFWMTLFESK